MNGDFTWPLELLMWLFAGVFGFMFIGSFITQAVDSFRRRKEEKENG